MAASTSTEPMRRRGGADGLVSGSGGETVVTLVRYRVHGATADCPQGTFGKRSVAPIFVWGYSGVNT